MNKDQLLDDIVKSVKQMYVNLQRTPLKLEIIEQVCSRHTLETVCGGYKNLLAMCDIPVKQIHRDAIKKPTNDMFIRDIPLDRPNKTMESLKIEKTILIAGDMHLPWVHKPTLEKFYAFNKKHKPDIVIQIGDLYDMYAHTRFPKSQNIYTPKEEEKIGRGMAEEFWKRVHEDNEKARRIQFKGNHDVRPVKRAQEQMPSIEHFVEAYMERLFTFEGVEVIEDPRAIVDIEGVAFHHGFLSSLGQHRDHVLKNIVIGHTHVGGVSYRGHFEQTLWELNVGLMGDPESKVMSYTATKENKWTLGFGYIDEHGPRFITT